jgi:hypothetical protein
LVMERGGAESAENSEMALVGSPGGQL